MNKVLLALLKTDASGGGTLIASLEAALDEMETELEKTADCPNRKLSADLSRVIKSGGKRLRPVLAFLGYQVGRSLPGRKETDYPVVPLMTAVELIHTASLIHDDIVDEACVRRKVPTINATSGNWQAVQAGDYLLARAGRLARQYRGLDADRHFAMTAKEMCVAEFMQMESEYRLEPDSEQRYFEQIRRKTAAFMAAAAALGAQAAGAGQEAVQALEEYGTCVGLAFQIRDDVLDFASDDDFGKKCGQDLMRGIFTLPLLRALNAPGEAGSLRQQEARRIALSRNRSEEQLQSLLRFVRESDAIRQVQEEITGYTKKASEALQEIPVSEAKNALLALSERLAVRCI